MRQARVAGKTDAEIRTALELAGWTVEQVGEVLRQQSPHAGGNEVQSVDLNQVNEHVAPVGLLPRRNDWLRWLIRSVIAIALVGMVVVVGGRLFNSYVWKASGREAEIKNRDAQRVADMVYLQLALAKYEDDHGQTDPRNLSELVPQYLKEIPRDPLDTPYAYTFHVTNDTVDGYHLGVSLEREDDPKLSGDPDCNSIRGFCGSFRGGYDQATAFDGTDQRGCRGETGRHCYDVVR